MFIITTNRSNNRVIIEHDGYLPSYNAYEQGAPIYKVSMSKTNFIELLPISISNSALDDELENIANNSVNFGEEMTELVRNKDKSLHFIRKLSKVE